ncbi:ComEC/Rec2 family competence protein [Novosphingobium lindaniclasticum]|uniref:ComEC/Rec2 family competence protein n=1 Tax=Novosphingobium lindaniclasticum TaxID=1329895 RepID=UPI002409EBDB|nr:ComEC/Rec2 family competence protein [Novosphingobium lindaniclasticum]
MASEAATTDDPLLPVPAGGAALQHCPWISQSHMSSSLPSVERFLSNSGFDRVPWLAVAFGTGAIAWFSMPRAEDWVVLCVVCVSIALFASWWNAGRLRFPYTRQALLSVSLFVLAGCLSVWTRSEIVGQPPIARPVSGILTARVLALDEQPALQRDRLTLALRDPQSGRAVKARVNLPVGLRSHAPEVGAVIRFRGRLVPPASPMFPGGYDFARTAWFAGLSATGSVTSDFEVLSAGAGGDWLAQQRLALSRHITSRLAGSAGGIAAALITGDMGAISQDDAQDMRDAGLAHLLSISGLHVSAVIGCVYFVVLRLLALSPTLALRVRLPVLAAAAGAAAGLAYTLLSGSQVPTVRSCLAGLLVLAAVALGREALSMRLLAVAAILVLLMWPEAVVGPSFQMSFAAVIVLIALGNAAWAKRLLAPREEAPPLKALRYLAMMLVTGVVIELALMPIGLFHFHRAGVYGSLANVAAIPLTTVIIMPLVATALLLDLVGLGIPVWWAADRGIDVLLSIAHFTATRPAAVSALPAMGAWHFASFVAGGLWLALWTSRIRLLGLLPISAGFIGLLMIPTPDVLISGDGRHVAWLDPMTQRLVTLRKSTSDYALDNMMEAVGTHELPGGTALPGTRCNRDFCHVALRERGEKLHLLIARSRALVPEMQLERACRHADIVIADRWLPGNCRPKWLKLDRQMLDRTGGVTIHLASRSLRTVSETQGDHGWWPHGKR